MLLREIRFTANRGTVSEIRYLAGAHAVCTGPDADTADLQAAEASLHAAAALAERTGAVIMMTGKADLLTDGKAAYSVQNGHPLMSRITGCGCMLSAMTAAYLAALPQQPFDACLTALCAMGLAGEIAADRMTAQDGNASFRRFLTDAVYNLTEQQLEEGARYEHFR